MSTAGKIGITLGDPSGVGPEIVARAIAEVDAELRARLLVFCDLPILERAFAEVCGERVPADLSVVDRGQLSCDNAVPGRPSAAGAKAQVAYLEAAASAARGGQVAAVVTAPISKSQAVRAGFEFPGQTEFFASRLRAERTAMMFVGPKLKVSLATVHIALGDVVYKLTAERIVEVTTLTVELMRTGFGCAAPRVGVIGLNPHAGEGGAFGREEIDLIEPAIEECRRALGPQCEVSGPLVPDVVFRDALAGKYDALVAMYHDQALIPVKMLEFERSVNLTLGLPVVRTSPAHGVAYDIAGSGRAQHRSFVAALELAAKLTDRAR